MKFSYSQKLDKYVVTELGKLIDSDEDGAALLIRHGFLSDQSEDEEQESASLTADDDDTDYSEQLAIASDDDDLEVIREFLGD